MRQIPELTPQEVRSRLRDGEVTLLDCREDREWACCRIEGALHMPMGDIPGRMHELDPEKPVIIYCHKGVRSYNVALFLAEHDFSDVASMAGGIDAWSRQVDPAVPRY